MAAFLSLVFLLLVLSPRFIVSQLWGHVRSHADRAAGSVVESEASSPPRPLPDALEVICQCCVGILRENLCTQADA